MSKQDNLDLIFGGHDHKYFIHFEESSSVFLTKSGYDFFDFTNFVMYEGVTEDDAAEFKQKHSSETIAISYSKNLQRLFMAERVPTEKIATFTADPEMQEYVDKLLLPHKDALEEVAYFDINDNTHLVKNEQESSLGNLMTDMVRIDLDVQIAMV